MSITFKQYLITEATKGKSSVKKMFNPERFRNEIEKVLDQMIKRGAKTEENMINELVMIEAISIVKEVMADRLMPYLDPKYAERKEKDAEKTTEVIADQIKETLHYNFPSMKAAMNQFVNLIALPILDEVKRAGLHQAAKNIDMKRFGATSLDSFGYLMRYVMNSDIAADVQDAAVAKELLNKWSKQVRVQRQAGKKVKRRQRRNAMDAAVEAIISAEGSDEKEEEKE